MSEAAAIIGQGIARLAFDGLRKVSNCRSIVALLPLCRSPCEVCRGANGIDLDCLVAVGEGILETIQSVKDSSAMHISRSQLRIDFNRAREVSRGRVKLAGCRQNPAAAHECLGMTWIQPERIVQVSLGLIYHSERFVGQCETII